MPEISQQGDSSSGDVVERVVQEQFMQVRLPIVGQVRLPSMDHLIYLVGVGVLAALDLIEWPVALVVVGGHLLAQQRWSRVAEGLGQALEEA